MATLQTIRKKGKLLAIVIGFALFAFILSDFLGKGSGSSRDMTIAEISGKSVSYMEYQSKVDYLTEITSMYSNETSLDDEAVERIKNQTWDQLLRENILDKEYEKLGISVPSDEVFEMVQGRNAHPYIRQLFTDPNTGQFDHASVLRFLKSMDQDPTGNQKAYWLFLEEEILNERKYSKYNNLLLKGLYVPSQLVNAKKIESTRSVNIEYIVKKFNSVDDSSINVADSDIETYYDEHQKEYKQESARDIDYVVFNVVPSDNDDAGAKIWIDKIYDEFVEITDDKEFVNYNSEVPFDDKNYKNDELAEIISNFMFDAKIGDVYGPYFENDAYKISKLSEINYLPDSVHARHILIDGGKTKEVFDAAEKTADSLKEVILNGGNFDQLARLYSIDTESAKKGGDLGWFKEGVMVKPFNDTCFSSNVGDIKIAKSQFGFHIIELLKKGKKVKKVKVATIENPVVPSTETYQFYYAKASKFAGNSNSYDDFMEGLKKEGLSKRTVSGIKETDKEIPGMEFSREIVRWAYKAEEKALSPIFEIGNKYVVAILTKAVEEGFSDVEDVELKILPEIKKQKKGEKIAQDLASSTQDIDDINKIGTEISERVQQSNNVKFKSFSAPGIGFEPKVIATANVLNEGEVSEPIIGNNGVYIIKVTSINEDVEFNFEAEKSILDRDYTGKIRSRNEGYETLKDLAEIKDNRAKFF